LVNLVSIETTTQESTGLALCERQECKYYTLRKTPITEIKDEDWNNFRIYYIAKLKEKEYDGNTYVGVD
jgi:hypothetical protein